MNKSVKKLIRKIIKYTQIEGRETRPRPMYVAPSAAVIISGGLSCLTYTHAGEFKARSRHHILPKNISVCISKV